MSAVGMKCDCGGASAVVETRKSSIANALHRRRQCRSCGQTWATVELPYDLVNYVFKENKKVFAIGCKS